MTDPAAALLPSGDELLHLMKIDQTDLLANREGRLGERQRGNQRRRAALTALVLLMLSVLFALGGVMSHRNGGQWFVPELFAAGFVVLAAVMATAARRNADPEVRCLTGPAEVIVVSAGRAGTALRLVVGGQRCILPTTVRSTRTRWDAALTGPSYRVYDVVGKIPQVVGIEPAS